ELERMHRDARRGRVRFRALVRELVALAGVVAQLLELQGLLARPERVATARELLRRRDQAEVPARDVASQAELRRFAPVLSVEQLRARRFRGALVLAPEVQLEAGGALHLVNRVLEPDSGDRVHEGTVL